MKTLESLNVYNTLYFFEIFPQQQIRYLHIQESLLKCCTQVDLYRLILELITVAFQINA